MNEAINGANECYQIVSNTQHYNSLASHLGVEKVSIFRKRRRQSYEKDKMFRQNLIIMNKWSFT